MIQMMKLDGIDGWLVEKGQAAPSDSYTHRLLEEQHSNRSKILAELRSCVESAHADTKRYLDREGLSEISEVYPSKLPLQTLTGYFGEVLTAIVVETYSPFGKNGWRVPAFLFHLNDQAFEYLENLILGEKRSWAPFGQQGYDCIAFQRRQNGDIKRILICEAKCTSKHSSKLIHKAHSKLSDRLAFSGFRISQMISILKLRNDEGSRRWADALQRFRMQDPRTLDCRFDLVCYTCGNPPKPGEACLPVNAPHDAYKGGRPLEAIEIHLEAIRELVSEIYGAED